MQMKRIVALVVLVMAWSAISPAQTETAVLSGRITDPKGAVLSGVQVVATNIDTNVSVNTSTNDLGLYVISSLAPGHYRLTINKEGFKVINLSSLTLSVQDTISRNFELQVGSTSEFVTVVADATDVRTSPVVATVIDSQLVRELPLNGRSFQTLFQLTPGVVTTPASFNNQGQFSVNGQRTSSNYVTVDGAGANVAMAAGVPAGQSFNGSLPAYTASGGTNGLVSVDAVQEFAIETSSYAPEFGRTSGGQISIVTRSGTNAFHGEAFDYLRNNIFDANDWFANNLGLKKAQLRQNDFGGTFGGPLRSDKTFFFFSYEGLRLRQPTTGSSDVPTVAARQSAPATIQPYLNAFSLPTGADEGNGLAPANYSFSNPTMLNAVSLRIDHHITKSVSVFGRYNYAPSSLQTRLNGSSLSTVSDTQSNLQTLTLGSTYVITPRLANEGRFNWSRSSVFSGFHLDQFGGAVPLAASQVFPAGLDSSQSEFFFELATGLNTRIGLGPNVRSRQEQFNVVDSLSWQLGNHLVKLGVDFRRLAPTFGPAGYVQTVEENDIQSAINMTADVVALASASTVQGNDYNYSLFGQDGWRLSSRLNVTYGMRWDYNPTPTAHTMNGVMPVAINSSPDFSNASLVPAGAALYHATKNNFAPRLGLTYQLRNTRGSEAVLRGGYGIFYDLASGLVGNVFAEYPFVASSFNFTPQSFPLSPAAATAPPLNGQPPFSAIQAFPSVLKQPYTEQWNLAYEQTLGTQQSVTLGYVGSSGHSLVRGIRVFAPPLPSSFTQVNFATNDGYSNYNSMQLSFRRRAMRGLDIVSSYTWSHSLDNASDEQGSNAPSQFVEPTVDYASSDFDIRHTGTVALNYQVPDDRWGRIPTVVTSGWGMDFLLVARSAPPVNVTVTRILNFGQYNFRPDVTPGDPLYTYGSAIPGGRRFDASALSVPAAPIEGSLARNTFRGFPLLQSDVSLRRRFKLTERIGLQAVFEVFNFINHPNFSSPSGNLGIFTGSGVLIPNKNFGTASSMLNQGLAGFNAGFNPLYQIGGPRSLQLALKLDF